MIRQLIEQGSIIDIVATVIAFLLILATVLCIIYIIIAGLTFILSAGNEERIKKAINTFKYALIGLVITFVAFFAVSWIARLLDIPFNLSFSTIIDLMNELFAALKQ